MPNKSHMLLPSPFIDFFPCSVWTACHLVRSIEPKLKAGLVHANTSCCLLLFCPKHLCLLFLTILSILLFILCSSPNYILSMYYVSFPEKGYKSSNTSFFRQNSTCSHGGQSPKENDAVSWTYLCGTWQGPWMPVDLCSFPLPGAGESCLHAWRGACFYSYLFQNVLSQETCVHPNQLPPAHAESLHLLALFVP